MASTPTPADRQKRPVARLGDQKCRVFAERYPSRDVGPREPEDVGPFEPEDVGPFEPEDVGPADSGGPAWPGGEEGGEDGGEEDGLESRVVVIHFYHEADYPDGSPFYA